MNNLHIVPSIDFFNVLNFFYLTLIVRFFCTRGTDHGFVGDVKHPPPPPPPPHASKEAFNPVLFLQLYSTIIVNLILRQLIKKREFLTSHCTHTNAAF